MTALALGDRAKRGVVCYAYPADVSFHLACAIGFGGTPQEGETIVSVDPVRLGSLVLASSVLLALSPAGVAGQPAGLSVELRSGSCSAKGAVVEALHPISPTEGAVAGAVESLPATSGYGVAATSLNAMLADAHSIAVSDANGEDVACGEVGGLVASDGSLVFGLRPVDGSGINGIAYLSATDDGSGQAGVSLFLSGSDLPDLLGEESVQPEDAVPAGAIGPTPTPTVEERMAAYTWLPDVRELAIRPGTLIGEEYAFAGTIMTIQVAPPGDGYFVGDQDPQLFQAVLQVNVVAPDGSTEFVTVGYSGDTAGMFEGTYVSVYGEVVGTRSGENRLGGQIIQPLVAAEFVVIG